MLLSAIALTACHRDSDGDGLTDRAETALGLDPRAADGDADGLSDPDEIDAGTDPANPDTDADRLLDGLERPNGADPLLPDTDGDEYLDGDEVAAHAAPDDPESVIYRGGWPYYPWKDDIDPNRYNFYEVGARFFRLQMVDQFGDVVDLFDFYNADRPVVLHVAAMWAWPDWTLDQYIRGEGDPEGLGQYWPAGPAAVARGDVRWITVLEQGQDPEPATPATAAEYAESFTVSLPILADPDYSVADYVALDRWPTVVLLDAELRVVDTEGFREERVLAALNEQFPE